MFSLKIKLYTTWGSKDFLKLNFAVNKQFLSRICIHFDDLNVCCDTLYKGWSAEDIRLEKGDASAIKQKTNDNTKQIKQSHEY